jgi:outer membrane protein OmpA-like peptidoglycan-associated protein
MMRRIAGLATSATFTGCIVLTCSSCSVFHGTEAAAPSRPEAAASTQHTRLAQLAYGRDAKFAVCVEPACPKVTPKTLASANAPIPVVLREPVAQPAPTAAIAELPAPSPVHQLPAKLSEPATRNIVVNFPFASAELTAETKAAIQASLELARQADRIVISGRTDVVGDLKANEALALSRALAVRNYFRDVAPDLPATIAIDAKGRCCFIASNADERGRSKNRRVEIVFTSHGGA